MVDANQQTEKSVAGFKPEQVVVHSKRQHPEALSSFRKLRSMYPKQFEFSLVDAGNVDHHAGMLEVVEQVIQVSRRLVWWIWVVRLFQGAVDRGIANEPTRGRMVGVAVFPIGRHDQLWAVSSDHALQSVADSLPNQ